MSASVKLEAMSPSSRNTSNGLAWAGPFAELIAWRTYANAFYLLIALPLGIAYFVALVVGFAVGLALAITLIGVPVLLATVALVSSFAGLERSQARSLVGLEMPNPVREASISAGTLWNWARGYISRAVFWKSLTYLILKLPWGILSFTVVITLGAVGIALLAVPLYAPNLPEGWGFSWGASQTYQPTFLQALSLSVVGLGVSMIAARIINLMALVSARIARFMLTDNLEDAQTQRLRIEALTLASNAASLVSSVNDRGSLTATLEALMASVSRASDANACALIVQAGPTRRVAAAHGFAGAQLEAALQELRLEPASERVAAQARVTKPRSLNGSSLVVIPLLAGGRSFGDLIATYPNSQNPDRSELEFLRAIADQSSLGLENARLIAAARDGAALEERHRLARELHDSVSQALYGIALGARTAKAQLTRDPQKVAEPLDYVLQLAEAGLTEMRALIFELRPEALETEGLAVALRKQADAVRVRHKLNLETVIGDEPEVGLEVKQALLRIVQEALHNTVKHAKATRATLRLETSASQLLLEIADDGLGFDSNARFDGHLGQRSMRERAESIGARFELQTAPGAGTRIRVQLPLETPSLNAP
jgi:signal transduction histidine kinase